MNRKFILVCLFGLLLSGCGGSNTDEDSDSSSSSGKHAKILVGVCRLNSGVDQYFYSGDPGASEAPAACSAQNGQWFASP